MQQIPVPQVIGARILRLGGLCVNPALVRRWRLALINSDILAKSSYIAPKIPGEGNCSEVLAGDLPQSLAELLDQLRIVAPQVCFLRGIRGKIVKLTFRSSLFRADPLGA